MSDKPLAVGIVYLPGSIDGQAKRSSDRGCRCDCREAIPRFWIVGAGNYQANVERGQPLITMV